MQEADRFSITLVLAPDEHAAGEARHELHQFLAGREVDVERVGWVELVVSELVTNAVAAGSAEVEVYARVDRNAVRIWVSDEIPVTPYPHEPSADGDGWGLNIIHQVAARWGVRPRVDDHPGKTVWADVLLS